MPVIFSIAAIKVNSINNASVFSIGQNIIIGFTNSSTNNQGTGQNFGDGLNQPASLSTGFDTSTSLGGIVGNTPISSGTAIE